MVLGKNFLPKLLEYIDEDQLPTFLGGTNTKRFIDDTGPWHEYELVDSTVPGQ